MVKVRGRNSNRNTVKQTKKEVARASVCDVSGADARSSERFEMFMISQNHFIGELP